MTIRTLTLTAGLLAGLCATGCSSRPKPTDVILRVESTKPGIEYRLTGTVDLDGKPVTVDQKTPYRFTANGLTTNAKLTSTDADCHLMAGYEAGAARELVSEGVGPAGCVMTLSNTYKEKTSRTQILIVALPLPVAPVAPVAAAPVDKPEEKSAEKSAEKPAEQSAEKAAEKAPESQPVAPAKAP